MVLKHSVHYVGLAAEADMHLVMWHCWPKSESHERIVAELAKFAEFPKMLWHRLTVLGLAAIYLPAVKFQLGVDVSSPELKKDQTWALCDSKMYGNQFWAPFYILCI